MKNKTKILLVVCFTVLLVIGIGAYAYVSDYYHADETAMEAMGEVTGSTVREDITNRIFARFCVGK